MRGWMPGPSVDDEDDEDRSEPRRVRVSLEAGDPARVVGRRPGALSETILRKTDYPFFGNGSSSQDVPLSHYIEVTPSDVLTFVVRVHASSLAAGQSFRLSLQKASESPDEPGTTFFAGGGAAIATISSATTIPTVIVDSVTAPVPSHVRLLLTATQAAGATAMSVTLSATILRRRRGARSIPS